MKTTILNNGEKVIEIKTIFGKLIFSYEKENNTIKDTLLEAIKEGSNLRRSNLQGADLYGADLEGANLQGANLDKGSALFS